MPPWGRPPGRRRDMYDAGTAARFQDLDSDEDGRGVFAYQEHSSGTTPPFISDRLYSNDSDTAYREEDMAYGEDYGYSEDDYEYERQAAPLVRRKFSEEQEEIITQRALEKIRRSRAAGRTDVNLTYEELDALERRRVQQQPPPRRATPQGKVSSRTSSPNSVRSRKGSWVRPAGLLNAAASPVRSRKEHRSSRRTSDDATAIRGPGFAIAGPSGTSNLVPLGGYQHAQTPPHSRSRQSSQSRSRQIISPTPQYESPQYAYANRPPSSSSRSSSIHKDEPDWALRSRNSFIAQQNYQNDPLLYQSNPSLAQPQLYPQGRRVTSGPSDVAYANLRRMPATVGRLPTSNSDPVLGYRGLGSSGVGDEDEYVDVAAEDSGRNGRSERRRRVRR
ncbi:hypothetical protein H2201_007468 [Coniosporium apollinis]|uniref:Uncharacterized protein n=1 Tax=Coniosporium apollinis TaxID=61459 RepID=A0ABQ9NN68_9PEZI|nr:hypothetical protein H2201_007468 [Coniosporium apollinis]